LFFSYASYWEYEFFLECVLEYAPLDAMAIIAIIANQPFSGLPRNLK
jgi:hypothetical protein